MKRRISVSGIIAACILLFFCLAVWKGTALHEKYPNPQVTTYQYGETVQNDGYQITFSGWQWGNESLIRAAFPDFKLAYMEVNGKTEDSRVGLINFTITKVSDSEDSFNLANIGFSSGAWGNQFDMELFYMLNPEMDSMVLDLPVGGQQQIVLPLTLLESQFTAAQWREIDSREFYINLQYYPEHIRFLCPRRSFALQAESPRGVQAAHLLWERAAALFAVAP